MRVAIIGGSGLLGKYLLREWNGDEVIGFASKDFDIRDPHAVQQNISSCRADWIVLAAAYTDVDGCETNPELAFQTNYTGALNVAEAAKREGARLLFLSTDYVFDGTKLSPYEVGDQPNPQTIYGHTKAQAEKGILQMLPRACIVRTSWVFGTGGRCFPATILTLAETRRELDVVNDQRGCPTYARDLARAILQLCRADAQGVVHVTNQGNCTWFEFASDIVRVSKLPTIIRPTTSKQFPRPAKRPQYSVLSGRSLKRFGVEMPRWRVALRDYVQERQSSTSPISP